MVTRIKIEEHPYVNIIALIYIFCVVEIHLAMSKIHLYNQEYKKWNIRNLFWYSIIAIPTLTAVIIFATAAIKYISD